MVLMPMVLVRGGRLSEVTILQAAYQSLLCVYTRTLMWTVLPSYMCSCMSLPPKLSLKLSTESNTQAASRGNRKFPRLLTRIFSVGSGIAMDLENWATKKLSCPRPPKSLEILYGPKLLVHTINSFSLMRLYFWKMGTMDIGSFYILTAALVKLNFLLVNHTEIALGSGRS